MICKKETKSWQYYAFAIHLSSGTCKKITGIGEAESQERWVADRHLALLYPEWSKLSLGQGMCWLSHSVTS